MDRVGVIPLLSGDDTSHNGAAEQPIPLLTHDVPSEMLAPSFLQPHYGDPQLIQSAVSGDKRPKAQSAPRSKRVKMDGERRKHKPKVPGPVDYSPQKVEALFLPSGVDEGMLPVRAAEGPSVEKRAKSRGRTGRPRKSDLKVIKMIMKWGPGGEQWFMKQKGSGRPKKGEEVVRFQVPFSMVVRQDPWQYRYVDGHLETIDETAPLRTPVTLGHMTWEEYQIQCKGTDSQSAPPPMLPVTTTMVKTSAPATHPPPLALMNVQHSVPDPAPLSVSTSHVLGTYDPFHFALQAQVAAAQHAEYAHLQLQQQQQPHLFSGGPLHANGASRYLQYAPPLLGASTTPSLPVSSNAVTSAGV